MVISKRNSKNKVVRLSAHFFKHLKRKIKTRTKCCCCHFSKQRPRAEIPSNTAR